MCDCLLQNGKSFQFLEQEGCIARHRRKGTFVCEKKLKRNLNNLYNFTTEMHAIGLTPSSAVISFESVLPRGDRGLTRENLSDSLYAIISEHTGLLPGEAVETYEAINLSKREAQHLTCQPASAALKITRISRNTSGEIFEYCTIITRGDMNKYQIILKNNGMQYSHVI